MHPAKLGSNQNKQLWVHRGNVEFEILGGLQRPYSNYEITLKTSFVNDGCVMFSIL